MTRLRLASAAAIMAFLAVPVAYTAWSQDKADPKAAGGDKSELYQQLNLFGDVLERVRARLCRAGRREDADRERHQRHADLARPALELHEPQDLQGHAGPDQGRVRRAGHRGHHGERRGQGGVADRRHARRQGRRPAGRPDHSPRRRAGAGADPAGGGREDARQAGTPIKIGDPPRRQGPVRRQADARGHQGQVGALPPRGGDIGYIRVTSFTEQTTSGVHDAVEKLKKEAGGKLKGFVLDLRNNPGGLLDQAIAMSDAFLDKGEIVSVAARKSEDVQRWNAKPRRRRRRPADRRADQRRLGLGLGDRGRRPAGPQAGDRSRHPLVRQGLGADHHAGDRAAAPSASPRRSTSRRRAARSRRKASSPTSRSSPPRSRTSRRVPASARRTCAARSSTPTPSRARSRSDKPADPKPEAGKPGEKKDDKPPGSTGHAAGAVGRSRRAAEGRRGRLPAAARRRPDQGHLALQQQGELNGRTCRPPSAVIRARPGGGGPPALLDHCRS